MQELRRRMDQIASSKASRHLDITAWVFGSEEENLLFALDVRQWVPVWIGRHDHPVYIPYTSAARLYSWELAWEDLRQVDHWLNLVKNTRCRLALNVMPRNLTWKQYRKKAHALYQAGVENLAFWDSSVVESSAFPLLPDLGHREALSEWSRLGEPEPQTSSVALKSIQNWEMTFIPE